MPKNKIVGCDLFWQKSQAWEEARRLQLKGKVTQVMFDGYYWWVVVENAKI
jgi:hypothetical protein